MAENENGIDDYSDKPALFALFIFTFLVVLFNGYAIYAFIRNIISITKNLDGIAFDCFFYPKVSVLGALFFLGLISIILLLLTVSNCCNLPPEDTMLGNISMYCLYFLFGPLLCGMCFFFLANMDTYGYTCTVNYKKNYNIPLHIVLAIFGAVGVLVTVCPYLRKLIQKLSRSMSRRDGCCSSVMNYFVTDKTNEEEEYLNNRVTSQL